MNTETLAKANALAKKIAEEDENLSRCMAMKDLVASYPDKRYIVKVTLSANFNGDIDEFTIRGRELADIILNTSEKLLQQTLSDYMEAFQKL